MVSDDGSPEDLEAIPEADWRAERIEDIPHLFISSLTRQGLTTLKDKLWEMLNPKAV